MGIRLFLSCLSPRHNATVDDEPMKTDFYRDYEKSLLRYWTKPFRGYGEFILHHWKKRRPGYYKYLRDELVLEEAVWIAIENEERAVNRGWTQECPVDMWSVVRPPLQSLEGVGPDLPMVKSARRFTRLPSEDRVPCLQSDQAPFGQPGDKEPYRFPYECSQSLRSLMKMREAVQKAESLPMERLVAEPGRLTQYTIEPKEISVHLASEVTMLMYWRMQSALVKTLTTSQAARIPLSCYWLKATAAEDRLKVGIWDGGYPPSGRPLVELTALRPEGTAPFMLEMSVAGLKRLDYDYGMVLSLGYYARSVAWAWLLMDK